MTDLLTAADILKAIAALRDNTPPPPCTHVVHPRYFDGTWERVYDWRDGDVLVSCAMLCGGSVVFRRKQ